MVFICIISVYNGILYVIICLSVYIRTVINWGVYLRTVINRDIIFGSLLSLVGLFLYDV
jgi:uncharacterized membrane protein